MQKKRKIASYLYCSRPSRSAWRLKCALSSIGTYTKRIGATFALPATKGLPLINWGCTSMGAIPRATFSQVLNTEEAVAVAVSKIKTGALLSEAASAVPCVRITTDRLKALEWSHKGYRVLARQDGLSSGAGIHEFTPEYVGKVDFYARVFPKTHEYRVHICGEFTDLVEKKASLGHEDADRLIRCHDNGWIFAHEDLSCTEEDKVRMVGMARSAIEKMGLAFGAVDVLAVLDTATPRRIRNMVVCEVNTAPGLENEATIMTYAKGIAKMVENVNL